ncbi:hypothetical protein ANCDUO_22894 [Ancylostoma duodenale]|uniref:Uncharacterized protein n=1 Tax=Ancylostoma duodenale TaxID=51022 RepID=A0A0C2FEP9_9BILA|nr:hypothetical protein ANCDUO_22894 [Ancylostoma duodenale]
MMARRQKPREKMVWSGIKHRPDSIYGEEMWIFQQDDATEETQEWVATIFPDFISVDISPQPPGHCPANSPDLNPLN